MSESQPQLSATHRFTVILAQRPPDTQAEPQISFTPRVLLRKTKDFVAHERTRCPPISTGTQPLAGKTALIPVVGFWADFAGRCVIRRELGLDPDPERCG